MVRSRSRLKDKMIELYKLYIKDTIIFLGNSKIYPLRPIADSTVTCAHTIYNGNNLIAQTITVIYNGETLIKNVDYVIKTNNGGVNAGDYTVILKGINNYDGEVTGTFTIDKAAGIIITAPEAKNLTYNGTALNLVTAGNGTGTMMYKLGNNNWSSSIPTAINTGSYTVQFKAVESANYLESPVSSTIVTISKADSSYIAPSAKTLTYNTSALTLLNAGSTNHGTILYSSNNSTWSTTIPTGTNVGTYTTYWRIIGDSNHNDKDSASIKTTISAKVVSNPTITLSQDSYSYNGNAKLPSVTSVKDGSIVIPSSEYTVSYSNNTNVGTATVTITDKLGGNYTVSGNKSFTITKVNPTYTAPTGKTGLVYNGNNLNLLNAGLTNHGTILYSSNNSTWSTSIPLTKNAGNYTLYWRLVGDNNHNDISSTSIAVSIAKANQNAPTATGATTTYNTTATASASGGGGQGSIEWESAQSQTSIGSHTTRARWTGNSNYNASSWSNTVTVKMDKANLSASVSMAGWTYGEAASSPSVSGNSGNGTVTYSYKTANGSAYSSNKPSVAGTYTVKAVIAETTNYNGATVTTNFTIAKGTPKLWITLPNNLVKGDTKNITAYVIPSDLTVTYSSSDTNIASLNGRTITANNAGSCTITATTEATTNYNSVSVSYTLNVKFPVDIKIQSGERTGVGEYATHIRIDMDYGLFFFSYWDLWCEEDIHVKIDSDSFTTIGLSKGSGESSRSFKAYITDSNGRTYNAKVTNGWFGVNPTSEAVKTILTLL